MNDARDNARLSYQVRQLRRRLERLERLLLIDESRPVAEKPDRGVRRERPESE